MNNRWKLSEKLREKFRALFFFGEFFLKIFPADI